MFATVGKLLAVSAAAVSLAATPLFSSVGSFSLTPNEEEVVTQVASRAQGGDFDQDVVEIPASSPYAIQPVDEKSFSKTITMTPEEVTKLTEAEQAALQDTKVILSDSNGSEYITFEKAGSDQPVFGARISEKPCAGRHDFYRMVNTSGTNYCFANKGSKNIVRKNIKGVCPGANEGQIRYRYNNGTALVTELSPKRGPYPPSQYTTCHWFNGNKSYESKTVYIH